MFNHVIYLVPESSVVSGMGVSVDRSGTARAVFCSVSSVRADENFAGVQAGFKPVLRVKLNDRLDYQGEKLCEFEGKKYEVYRTYFSGLTNGIELYLQERGGISGR